MADAVIVMHGFAAAATKGVAYELVEMWVAGAARRTEVLRISAKQALRMKQDVDGVGFYLHRGWAGSRRQASVCVEHRSCRAAGQGRRARSSWMAVVEGRSACDDGQQQHAVALKQDGSAMQFTWAAKARQGWSLSGPTVRETRNSQQEPALATSAIGCSTRRSNRRLAWRRPGGRGGADVEGAAQQNGISCQRNTAAAAHSARKRQAHSYPYPSTASPQADNPVFPFLWKRGSRIVGFGTG